MKLWPWFLLIALISSAKALETYICRFTDDDEYICSLIRDELPPKEDDIKQIIDSVLDF